MESLRARWGVWTYDAAVAGIVVVVVMVVVGSNCGVAAVLVGQVEDVEVDVRAPSAVGSLSICGLRIGLVSTVMGCLTVEC